MKRSVLIGRGEKCSVLVGSEFTTSAQVFLSDFRGKPTAVKKIFFSDPDDESIVDFYKETRL